MPTCTTEAGIESTWHYEWRILAADMLIKPKSRGPNYDRKSLNQYYSSEEEAVEDWYSFNKGYPYSETYEMVLIKVFDRPYITREE